MYFLNRYQFPVNHKEFDLQLIEITQETICGAPVQAECLVDGRLPTGISEPQLGEEPTKDAKSIGWMKERTSQLPFTPLTMKPQLYGDP